MKEVSLFFIKTPVCRMTLFLGVSSMFFSSCKFDKQSIDLPVLTVNTVASPVVDNQYLDKFRIKSWIDLLPKTNTTGLVKHKYYILSYNEEAEQANWVAYDLKKEFLENNQYKRPYFISDPLVKTNSADWRNYKNSGYDKGHLCPAADMAFGLEAYNDTFYTSNVSPQIHEFNSGIWNYLEQKVRFWAHKYNGVFVVTGGVLNNKKRTIGTEKVLVPDYFYKIILDYDQNMLKVIAFLIPNKKTNKSFSDYVVTVDQIEKQTGIDFFPILEDSMEENIESKIQTKYWFSN